MTDDEIDRLRAWVAEHDPEILLADGFEDAFLGVADRCGQPAFAVYDVARCLAILVERDGMTEEGALEFFEFNTLGAWVGDYTPLFVWRWPRNLGPHD